MYELSKNDIETLKILIADFENFKGKWIEPQPDFPFFGAADKAYDSMRFLYDKKLIMQFDWSAWNEGRKLLAENDPGKCGNLDKEYVLKLLTTAARQDRFSECFWARRFESGMIQALLKRLLDIEISAGQIKGEAETH